MIRLAILAFLVASAGPCFAQAGLSQSPPAPNAASAAPTPPGSLPPGATNAPQSASPYIFPGVTIQTQPQPR